MKQLEALQFYALSFLGKPYIWGGDDPMRGFDCSGLVQEILAGVGMDPPGDQTAQGLLEHFKKNATESAPQFGAILFFGSKTAPATHVTFCLNDKLMLEAGGGGSKTITVEDATQQNAFVRIRPIKNRADLKACLMPNYSI